MYHVQNDFSEFSMRLQIFARGTCNSGKDATNIMYMYGHHYCRKCLLRLVLEIRLLCSCWIFLQDLASVHSGSISHSPFATEQKVLHLEFPCHPIRGIQLIDRPLIKFGHPLFSPTPVRLAAVTVIRLCLMNK